MDFGSNLLRESVLIDFCFWKLSRAEMNSSTSSSSSSLTSKSLRSIMIGLEKSWTRSRINRLPSLSTSESLLDSTGCLSLSRLNLTRASRLLCFRDWNCFRRSWKLANSSSDELPAHRISCNRFDALMSRETCFLAWKALRSSSDVIKWFKSWTEEFLRF